MAYAQSKDKSVSFRTYPEVYEEIKDLAQRVDKNKWSFSWDSNIRECNSVSGILHHLVAGNLTIEDIKTQVSEVEDEGN